MDTVGVRASARIFALLTLLGWLFAAAHVALEHGGAADGGVWEALHAEDHEAGCGGDADRCAQAEQISDAEHALAFQDEPAHHDAGPHHHHHELAALDSGAWEKGPDKVNLAPVWLPLLAILGELGHGWSVERPTGAVEPVWEHAPPDERASGWLLVVQTARPVRGPTLVA